MKENRIAGLVLAGGRSRRMGGGDKSLLTVGGRTMLAAAIAALDLPRMAISANGDPDRFAAFGLPVLSDDPFRDEGPLAGILAGMMWAASLDMTALLTVPGDTPFLPFGLAGRLTPAPACVSSGQHRHYLVALWPIGCAVELKNMLSVPGFRSVRRFAKRISMRYVEFDVQTDDPFANVNTVEDLARARARNDTGNDVYRAPDGSVKE